LLAYLLMKLHETNIERYYHEAMSLFSVKKEALTRVDKHNTTIDLANYALDKHLEGCSGFAGDRFKLYKDFFENEWYKEAGNKLSPINFRTIAAAACMAGEFDWAENFIMNNRNLIDADADMSVICEQVALAHLFTSKREIEKAIDLLLSIKHKRDVLYFLVNSQLVMCYLELIWQNKIKFKTGTHSEFWADDKLQKLIETFQVKIKNSNEIGKDMKTAYELYLKCANLLLRIFSSASRFLIKEYNELQELVAQNKRIINRYYIIQKLQELKKTYPPHFTAGKK